MGAPDHLGKHGAIIILSYRVADPIMTTPAAPLVLVVEDDQGVRRPLEKFLELHKFRVVSAETSDAGISAIQRYRPAAAIIDLRLAHGSGRDVVIAMPAARR